jgi:hypothetical protein
MRNGWDSSSSISGGLIPASHLHQPHLQPQPLKLWLWQPFRPSAGGLDAGWTWKQHACMRVARFACMQEYRESMYGWLVCMLMHVPRVLVPLCPCQSVDEFVHVCARYRPIYHLHAMFNSSSVVPKEPYLCTPLYPVDANGGRYQHTPARVCTDVPVKVAPTAATDTW